jgi:hypothetical protein
MAFGSHSTALSQGGFDSLAAARGNSSFAQTSGATLAEAHAVGTNATAETAAR